MSTNTSGHSQFPICNRQDSNQRIRYKERGPAVTKEAKQARARKMIREPRSLGYRVERVSTVAMA
jgi:hypothetical protein